MLNENIKRCRKQKGYSQETLAQSLNVVRQTVSKWEKGYSVPDAVMLEKMAEVFEVSVGDLLGAPSEADGQKSELQQISAQLAVLNDQMARELLRRKRIRMILLIAAAVFLALCLLVGCLLFVSTPLIAKREIEAGDISQVETLLVPSQLYSQDDIDAAIETIKTDFAKNWNGCKLTWIKYAGDAISKEESKERGVETIVLLSSFDTLRLPDTSALNENTTYNDWNWILIRSDDGQWTHIDHGYG